MEYDLLAAYFTISESSPSGLIWLRDNVDANNRINNAAGDIAGNLQDSKYWKVALKDRDYYVHRIVFLLHNGFITDGLVIDHVDRIRCNNKPDNLRQINHAENLRNNNHKPGKTGVKGVYYTASRNIVSAWSFNGKRGWSESFNVEELGLDEAIKRAKSVRNEEIAKLQQK